MVEQPNLGEDYLKGDYHADYVQGAFDYRFDDSNEERNPLEATPATRPMTRTSNKSVKQLLDEIRIKNYTNQKKSDKLATTSSRKSEKAASHQRQGSRNKRDDAIRIKE